MAEQNLIEVVMRSVDQMSQDLAKLDTQMGKLTGATTQLSGASKATSGALEQLNTAATALGVAYQPLVKTTNLLNKAWVLLKANAPLAALLATGTAAAALGKHFSDLGVEMGRASRQTGLTVETLSGLKVIAEGNDVSFGELTNSMRFFNRLLGQAALGGQGAKDIFDRLGISAKQLEEGLENPERLLVATAKGFSRIGSVAESTALQFRLFGRGGRDITAVLQELNEKGIDAARKKAEALRVLWTEDMVAAARAFNAAITTISQQLGGFAILLGDKVLPVMIRFLQLWEKLAGLKPAALPEALQLAELQHKVKGKEREFAAATTPRFPGGPRLPLPPKSKLAAELQEARDLIDQAFYTLPPIKPKVDPQLPAEADRAINDFAKNLRSQLDDTLTRLNTQEPFTATILGTRQIDQGIADFVEKLNRTLPDKLKISSAQFKGVRDDLTATLFTIQQDKLDQLMREGMAAASKAATEAAFSLAPIDDSAGNMNLLAESTKALEIHLTNVRHQADLFNSQSEATAITLQNQLEQYRLMEAPANKILDITRQLDGLDQRRISNQITAKENESERLRLLIEQGHATAEQQRAYESINAELEVLNARLQTAGQLTARELVNLKNTAEQMASGLARDFTDRFIALMKGEELKISDFFANLGETVVSQFLQAGMKALLVSPLQEMLMSLGEETAKKYASAGPGGMLFGLLKESLFPSAPGAKAASPLDMSAAALASAGGNLNTAALALSSAASMLQGSATGGGTWAGATTGGGFDVWDASDPAGDFSKSIGDMKLSLTGFAAAAPQDWEQMFRSIGVNFNLFGNSMVSGWMNLFASVMQMLNSLNSSKGLGGGLGSLLGLFTRGGNWGGATTGGGFDAWDIGGFAKGGIVVPKGFVRPFQQGGVTHGPVVGMIGEEGPEIVARMKPARAQDYANEQPKVQVIIEGDITPRRPEMTPEEVIRIVTSNGVRTRDTGIGGMVRTLIKRER